MTWLRALYKYEKYSFSNDQEHIITYTSLIGMIYSKSNQKIFQIMLKTVFQNYCLFDFNHNEM